MQARGMRRTGERRREAGNMSGSDAHHRHQVPRPVVAALIGAEAGAGAGLLFFGTIPLAPLGLAAAGALSGPLAGRALGAARHGLVRLGIRAQLRRAHTAPAAGGRYVAKR
jgi:hypothetical protein